MANSVLAKMAVLISANTAEFARAMQKSHKDLSTFISRVETLAGTMGVAFGVQQIAAFGLEVTKLAGEAEGVRAAFERLPESTKLMQELKRATGGTVSELELMKRAVQASNFGISLQALPKLLEFATLRAQQTGQSVDYLVDSIVTGIGRKSKLILDNLGISAVQLNEALGDTAIGTASIGQVADAVGKIIDENLQNMAEFSENAATKIQRLDASWANFKVTIGEAANETGLLGTAIDGATSALDTLSSRDLTKIEKIASALAFLLGTNPLAFSDAAELASTRMRERMEKEAKITAKVMSEVDRAFKQFKGNIDEFANAISPTHPLRGRFLEEFTKRLTKAEDDRITSVAELRNVEKELLAEREAINVQDTKALLINAQQIKQIRDRIKAIDDLLKKEKERERDISFRVPKVSRKQSKEGDEFYHQEIDMDPASGLLSKDERENPVSGIVQEIEYNDELAESLENLNTLREEQLEKMQRTAEMAVTMGSAIGDAFAEMVSGEKNLAQALASVTEQIITMYLQQSIAAMIASAIKDPSTPFPFAKVAIAAAGIGAVKALFSQLGGSAGGGSGGGRGGSSGASGYRPSDVRVGIEGRISGYSLAVVGTKESYRRSRLG
jgi:hypothetical protein